MSLEEILQLARQAISLNGEGERFTELLEQYTEELEVFIGSVQEDPSKKPSKEQLQQLAELHDQVLMAAESMKSDTADEMRGLQKKGRGIRAYLDHFPVPVDKKARKKT